MADDMPVERTVYIELILQLLLGQKSSLSVSKGVTPCLPDTPPSAPSSSSNLRISGSSTEPAALRSRLGCSAIPTCIPITYSQLEECPVELGATSLSSRLCGLLAGTDVLPPPAPHGTAEASGGFDFPRRFSS